MKTAKPTTQHLLSPRTGHVATYCGRWWDDVACCLSPATLLLRVMDNGDRPCRSCLRRAPLSKRERRAFRTLGYYP